MLTESNEAISIALEKRGTSAMYETSMNTQLWSQVVEESSRKTAETPKLDPREQHFRIPWKQGLNLFLRYLGPTAAPGDTRIVLYLHGATFPSALSIAHRFDGHSWRDELNAAGFHVWGLDFVGYGGSDRYPEMSEVPEGRDALGRAEHASSQVEKAIGFITDYHQKDRISIIAHSWGSMPAALCASRRPELIERIVFFAPIAQRTEQSNVKCFPAWRLISLEEQCERFIQDLPSGETPVLSKDHFDEWGPLYLDTDTESRTRSPASVKVPTGPVQEIAEGLAGKLAYDPALITTPVAIIRGEWDNLITDSDARWLFEALRNSPIKRDVKISRGTHLMHLESSRFALYREAQLFLEARDQPTPEVSPTNHTVGRKFSLVGGHQMSNTTLVHGTEPPQIGGYDYGRGNVARSPLALEELHQLEETVGWGEEDARVLQRHGDIFRENAEKMVSAWREVIGSQHHLVKWFFGPDGKRDAEYAEKVKKRFVQWVLDAVFRPHDRAWLDYQEEIGLRHTPDKKNRTDDAHTPPVVPLRYLLGFISVVTIATRRFFTARGITGPELQRLEDAWMKAVQLHVTLWSRAYTKEGLW